jgi:O-antigen/teichoic acid export membrane protein
VLANFFSDSAKYLFVKVIASFMWIATLKVYTTYLDPVDFGIYSITLSILAYASIAATSWLTASIIRFYHLTDSNPLGYRESIILLTLCSIFVIAILLYAVLYFLDLYNFVEIPTRLAIVIVGIFIGSALFNSYVAYLRASRNLTRYQWIYISQLLFGFIAGMVFLIYFDMGVLGIFSGLLLSYALALLYLLCNVNGLFVFTGSIDRELVSSIYKFGYPVIFINIFTQMLISSDQLMLKYFDRHAEVGEYAANYILAENSIFALSSLISSAFIPLVYRAWEKNGERETIKFFRKVLLVFTLVAGPFVILLLLFYDQVSILVIDEDYSRGAIIIPYVVIGAFFVGISNIFSEVLTIHKKTLVLMFCYMVPAITNVVLNYIFIPEFGMLGAAFNTMVSYFLLFVLIFVISQRYMRIIRVAI